MDAIRASQAQGYGWFHEERLCAKEKVNRDKKTKDDSVKTDICPKDLRKSYARILDEYIVKNSFIAR